MAHEFDKAYWERHWRPGDGGSMGASPPNPYLDRETEGLVPGTALDAGCGAGAEAIRLASRGWRVTGADISAAALARAAERAAAGGVDVRWVEADLAVWRPDAPFDLVMTHYAHPAMPQLDFYDRIAGWVAPGGTLLIVGHLHHDHGSGDDHPPAEASATAAAITARLDPAEWEVITAEEGRRTLGGHGQTHDHDQEQGHGDAHGHRHGRELHDVVVRAVRRARPASR
ncbi:class I SAM-dependent methyltransferase [Actinosynnema sp. NPDC059335]|uniref:class I SAM-dependent methyltransferase n=1 Tax=Actinosynnema sp. NPDC059335 TaxID=3346804 RepID=UPI0036718126